jgi:hypothetical protein
MTINTKTGKEHTMLTKSIFINSQMESILEFANTISEQAYNFGYLAINNINNVIHIESTTDEKVFYSATLNAMSIEDKDLKQMIIHTAINIAVEKADRYNNFIDFEDYYLEDIDYNINDSRIDFFECDKSIDEFLYNSFN